MVTEHLCLDDHLVLFDNPIRAVGFDLYGVMTVPPYSDMERYATDKGVPAGVMTAKFSSRRWLEDVQHGEVSVSAYVDETRDDVLKDYGVALDSTVIERFLDAAKTPVPAVVDVVREVRLSCRVGLLTNNLRGSQMWAPVLNEEMFDVIIDASSGIRKPRPAAYLALVEAFGVAASEVAFIDDSATNLEPAQELGLRTVLFRNAEQCRDELRRLGVCLTPTNR
jgi:epoxide hydrolase-like predicted phosphatase